MPARFFLDTNVFTYSFDQRSPAKQKRAQALIGQALEEGAGCISFQVIQEFLNVALRKFERPFSVSECHLYLDKVLHPLCEVFPSLSLYHRALELKEETDFGFYDCLVVASALDGDCRVLYFWCI